MLVRSLFCAASFSSIHLFTCCFVYKQRAVMERYERPKLCRLCRCPVADGGVPLSQLDRDKLSEWWLLRLDTEFDDEDEENEWICQFCVWDARLVINFNFSWQSFNSYSSFLLSMINFGHLITLI